MKYYKVTAINNGSRITISQPILTKKQAKYMANELRLNKHFSEVLIEQSAMK